MSNSPRRDLADTIDSYDSEITSLQGSKRETFQSYREELEGRGLDRDAIKAEIEAVKSAIKRRRAIKEKGAEVVESRDDLIDEILAEIDPSRAPRAARVEIIEQFDPETGEITDVGNPISDTESTAARMDVHPGRSEMVSSSQGDDTSGYQSPPVDTVQEMGSDGAHATEPAQNRPAEAGAPAGETEPAEVEVSPALRIPNVTGALEAETAEIERSSDPARTGKPPNCLNPRNCAGYGKKTCWECRKAHADEAGEAA